MHNQIQNLCLIDARDLDKEFKPSAFCKNIEVIKATEKAFGMYSMYLILFVVCCLLFVVYARRQHQHT